MYGDAVGIEASPSFTLGVFVEGDVSRDGVSTKMGLMDRAP